MYDGPKTGGELIKEEKHLSLIIFLVYINITLKALCRPRKYMVT